jgi:hypothetical protein
MWLDQAWWPQLYPDFSNCNLVFHIFFLLQSPNVLFRTLVDFEMLPVQTFFILHLIYKRWKCIWRIRQIPLNNLEQ